MRALARKLPGISAALEGEMAGALAASAARAAEEARKNVPVDTGELRASICWEAGGLSARVSAAAEHAALVEYGSRHMPPRPFMLRTAQAARQPFLREGRDALSRALKEI